MAFGDFGDVKEDASYETFTAEKIRFAAQVVVSQSVLRDARLEVGTLVGRDLVARLTATVLGRPTYAEVQKTQQVPRDWWQAVKARWFPRWALRRWPAGFDVVNTETFHYHTCPHIATPDTSNHFQWLAGGK